MAPLLRGPLMARLTPPRAGHESFQAQPVRLEPMDYFALSVFRLLASDTVRLEIFFDDDLLDLMNEAADLQPVVSYESVTMFASPARNDNTRNDTTRCDTAAEFVDAIRNVASTAVILTAERQPMTQDTPGYFDVYEAADAARGIILK